MWRWYASSDSCYCLDKTTITFQVIPTFNIPPPLHSLFPFPSTYLTLACSLSTLQESLWCLPDQPMVLSPVCWLSGGKSCKPIYTLCLKVKVDPCLDLSSPSLHSSTCLSLRSACLSPGLSPSSLHPPPPCSCSQAHSENGKQAQIPCARLP